MPNSAGQQQQQTWSSRTHRQAAKRPVCNSDRLPFCPGRHNAVCRTCRSVYGRIFVESTCVEYATAVLFLGLNLLSAIVWRELKTRRVGWQPARPVRPVRPLPVQSVLPPVHLTRPSHPSARCQPVFPSEQSRPWRLCHFFQYVYIYFFIFPHSTAILRPTMQDLLHLCFRRMINTGYKSTPSIANHLSSSRYSGFVCAMWSCDWNINNYCWRYNTSPSSVSFLSKFFSKYLFSGEFIGAESISVPSIATDILSGDVDWCRYSTKYLDVCINNDFQTFQTR